MDRPALSVARICVDRTNAADLESAIAWFEGAAPSLHAVSRNFGCGCCVDIFQVIGPPDVLATIPAALRAFGTPSDVDDVTTQGPGVASPYGQHRGVIG